MGNFQGVQFSWIIDQLRNKTRLSVKIPPFKNFPLYSNNLLLRLSHCTGVDDWNIVVIECKSLAAKWEQLSIYLGLSFEVTDNIKGSGDNYHCWSEALKHWIKQNYNTKKYELPSWRCLLKAVAKEDKLMFNSLAAQHQGIHSLCCDILPMS